MSADSIEMLNTDEHKPILPIVERERFSRRETRSPYRCRASQAPTRSSGTTRPPSRAFAQSQGGALPLSSRATSRAHALFGPPALDLPTPLSFHFAESPSSGLPAFVPRSIVADVKGCLLDGVVWTPDIQSIMEGVGRVAPAQDWLQLQWNPRSSHDETSHG